MNDHSCEIVVLRDEKAGLSKFVLFIQQEQGGPLAFLFFLLLFLLNLRLNLRVFLTQNIKDLLEQRLFGLINLCLSLIVRIFVEVRNHNSQKDIQQQKLS